MSRRKSAPIPLNDQPASAGFLLPETPVLADSNADADHECGRYALLKTHEDGGIEYAVDDVLEFTCEEAAFLHLHGVIGEPTTRPITKKRLVMSGCHGCGPTLVTEPPLATPLNP